MRRAPNLCCRNCAASAREPSRSSPRTGSLARLFFQPLEPFLVDDTASHKHPGRIARVALDPIWQWICRDLLPGEAKAVTDEVARAFENDDTAKAEALGRAFQDRSIQRMQEALKSAEGDDKGRRKLAAQIGTPRALEDVAAILIILQARDTLATLGKRLPGHIKNLADAQLDEVKALLDLPQTSGPTLFLSCTGAGDEQARRAMAIGAARDQSGEQRLGCPRFGNALCNYRGDRAR